MLVYARQRRTEPSFLFPPCGVSSPVEEPAASFSGTAAVTPRAAVDALRLQAIYDRDAWVGAGTFLCGAPATPSRFSDAGSRNAEVEAAVFVRGSKTAGGARLGRFKALSDIQ